MVLMALGVIGDAFAERLAGPLKFRLVLQPLMAAYLAIRHRWGLSSHGRSV